MLANALVLRSPTRRKASVLRPGLAAADRGSCVGSPDGCDVAAPGRRRRRARFPKPGERQPPGSGPAQHGGRADRRRPHRRGGVAGGRMPRRLSPRRRPRRSIALAMGDATGIAVESASSGRRHDLQPGCRSRPSCSTAASLDRAHEVRHGGRCPLPGGRDADLRPQAMGEDVHRGSCPRRMAHAPRRTPGIRRHSASAVRWHMHSTVAATLDGARATAMLVYVAPDAGQRLDAVRGTARSRLRAPRAPAAGTVCCSCAPQPATAVTCRATCACLVRAQRPATAARVAVLGLNELLEGCRDTHEPDRPREGQAADLHGGHRRAAPAGARRQAQPSRSHRADFRLRGGGRARRPHASPI